MPIYKNNTARTIHWKGLSWGPGGERRVAHYIPSASGLTLVGDDPVPVSPILVSRMVTLAAATPQYIEVPFSNRVKISAQTVGDSETASITIGGVSIILSPMVGWESVSIPWEVLGVLTLESDAGATVQLLVEAVN